MNDAKAIDVLDGRARWSAECADVLEWLPTLPDDSLDLLFTSPPYMGARTYGIGFDLDAEEWAAWMLQVVRVASPKVKGLIAVNCEGQTEAYAYQPAPFLFAADLYRAGFNLRKPPVFHRVGIPGSGGPDWLRNDWEPIVCVTRPGKLPWSDNTACGHAPKWAPGGEMSYRGVDGERKNGRATGWRRDKRVKDQGRTSDDVQRYIPPDIANPGNVVAVTVGGGRMGHPIARDNEAPFPLKLAEFFVLSFCPPGGVVCDPFSGSGTTAHAAYVHGRRFVGCDVRESQIELVRRRLEVVTPSMFAGVE